MSDLRVACLVIPDFLMQRLYRDNPALRSLPVAITESDHDTAGIVAVNTQAAETGVTLGMTAAQAHLACSDLIVKPCSHDHIAETSEQILRTLHTIGPFVESSADHASGVYFLETNGLERLYPNENDLAWRIITLINVLGFIAKVGLASGKLVAQLAAQVSENGCYTIVNNGAEKTFVADLDIACLSLSPDIIEKLRTLGLRTVGRLATFGPNEITERFGPDSTTLARLARGRDNSPFVRIHPNESPTCEMHLTYRIDHLDHLLHHTERLLQPLLYNLEQRGLGCLRLQLDLTLDNRHEHTLALAVNQPTASSSRFLRQVHRSLNETILETGVVSIRITIPETIPLHAEQLVFARRESGVRDHPDARLMQDQRIRMAVLTPAFLPERSFHLSPLRMQDSKSSRNADDVAFSTLGAIVGLRLLKAPAAIEITLQDGRPLAIGKSRQQRSITRSLGPWRVSGGWWERYFDRLYYRFETDHQSCYLCFFDRLRATWYLQGVFD